ncbi:MAG TPA: glycoside hydrolase family 2 TIM barrel-domain containing protein [Symbiobacteriaceae bacterium]|nr:glycoside hydrolase family 2 TIM barrel-domain containing protein [Symbiobacteriaceae bacterium]
MRDRISLNGTWRFEPTPGAAYLDTAAPVAELTRRADVPGCFQAQFEDLRDYADVVLYERTFAVPMQWRGKAIRLHFGAADYLAEVWVDGQYAGRHEGMFLPFSLDITHLVKAGEEQRLLVRVTDTGGSALPEKFYRQFPEISFKEAPHGKQSWYGPIGGLWQDVWLEAGTPVYIHRALATPDVSGRKATFRVLLAGPRGPLTDKAASTYTESTAPNLRGLDPDDMSVMVRVTAPDGTTFESFPVPVQGGEAVVPVGIPDPVLWSCESPSLYEFSATLLMRGRPVDLLRDTFGMRTVEARGNRIYLNGQPLYIRAALDQDYYPTTLWTPPSDEFLRTQMELAKEMGLNMLRCHIKAPDPRYLYWADRLGLLVWEEYGNFSHLEGRAGELGRATLEGMIERDFNHPSTIIWSIINESWGLNLGRQKDRQWLLEQYRHFKQVDPTRLICDNSACTGNFHLASDIADFHNYFAYPEHMGGWEAHVADLAGRPDWLYSPHGDAQPVPDAPLMNSEFGNWGLPDAHNLLDEQGREPWWFETGKTWSWGIVHPKHVRERYAASTLPTIFGDYRSFVKATQVQQYRALKYEIEAMRAQAALNGYVITEFTDIHWECNGLLDQMRNPKAGHSLYRDIIAGTQLISRPANGRWSYHPGEEIRVQVQVASDSAEALPGHSLAWWLETGVTTPLPAPGLAPCLGARQGIVADVTVPAFGVAPAGEVAVKGPATPGRVRLHLSLRNAVGKEVARSYADFAVFERVVGFDGVRVADKVDDDLLAFVTGGGCALLLAEGPDALPEGWPVKITPRKEQKWQGDWASAWHWLRPEVLHTQALENPLDLPWGEVLPEYVITGHEEQENWLSGMTVGWAQAQVATTVELIVGEGTLVVTTFRLKENLGKSPAAEALYAALLAQCRE